MKSRYKIILSSARANLAIQKIFLRVLRAHPKRNEFAFERSQKKLVLRMFE